MGQLIALDAGRVKGALKVDYDKTKDRLVGKLVIPQRGGAPVVKMIEVDLGEIRKQVQALLSNRAGWSLKGAQRALKRATSKSAMQKLLRTTDNIMKDPRFRGGIMLASTVFPPLGITYVAIQQGADIIQKAQKGDQQSQATLAAVNAMAGAQMGDPNAAAQFQTFLGAAGQGNPTALGAMQTISQLSNGGQVDAQTLLKGFRAIYLAQQQGADPGAAISGWFYNKKYRGVLEAATDLKSPGNVIRWATNRGMELEKALPRRKLFG